MSLDLTSTAIQIDEMAVQLKGRERERNRRLARTIEAFQSTDAVQYENLRAINSMSIAWAVPQTLGDLSTKFEPPPIPSDFCVLAVDGSHIDVDRHLPARCFLLNMGVSRLTYGTHPDAELHSEPKLFAADDELCIRDKNATFKEQSVEGAILGAKRSVEEIRFLVEKVQDIPEELPTLALMDGSLIMLGLLGRGYDDYVRKELLDEGFVAALEQLRQLVVRRRISVASYVSMPRSAEIVNAMRMVACPYEISECSRHCDQIAALSRPCEDYVGGLMDRDVWWDVLDPGDRSSVFISSSPMVKNHYGDHGVCFFYIHTGEEIGRVEIPMWVANNRSLLGLAHSLIYDQCLKGPGYPVGLMEAHEQAVVTGSDRQHFIDLIEQAMVGQRLPVAPSAKSITKRIRWL